MGSIRQQKIEQQIQQELAIVFQREARTICLGAMVTPTVVRVTPDISLAKVYLSIFAGPDKQEVLNSIKDQKSKVRGVLGQALKKLRMIPELDFRIDDSLDYAMEIDELLKK